MPGREKLLPYVCVCMLVVCRARRECKTRQFGSCYRKKEVSLRSQRSTTQTRKTIPGTSTWYGILYESAHLVRANAAQQRRDSI